MSIPTIFAALGDETRLQIVGRLCEEGPMSIVRLTDGTEADDPEGRAEDVAAEKKGRMPGTPFAGADDPLAFANPAGDAKEEGKREVGGRSAGSIGVLSGDEPVCRSRKQP